MYVASYLIGANAISLQLLKKGYRPSRGTKNIDFARMIASMEIYEMVTADMEKAGFKNVAIGLLGYFLLDTSE